ncbi:MAG: DNA primase DnaG, partial [Nanoarchaeota archaeon]
GKTSGAITIPSSLDKAETTIVAASLEIIQRIGPCNAKVKVERIEDVRVSKRSYVVERAKELLKNLMDNVMPDSQELAEEVSQAVRVMEVQEYGTDRLPAGPAVAESDEIIVVEGRADVLNLLKHGFKNVVGMNGTSVPQTIVELSKKKEVTAFVDGDRGGDLILKELIDVAQIDFVTKAPDGKEVEELAKKEIHQALRARVVPEQLRLERAERIEKLAEKDHAAQASQNGPREEFRPKAEFRPREEFRQERAPILQHAQGAQGTQGGMMGRRPQMMQSRRPLQREQRFDRVDREPKFEQQTEQREQKQLSQSEKSIFKEISGALIGTRGAYLFDEKLNILGKVPLAELQSTLRSLNNVYAIVLDGTVDGEMVRTAETAGVKCVVAMDSKVRPEETRLAVATLNEL